MKVFVSPVGKRDPWGTLGCQRPEPPRLGAVLGIALAVRPEVIFLLPTLDRMSVGEDHTMAEAKATADALAEVLPGARVCLRPYDLDDPTDYGQVMPETERLLRGILGEMAGDGDHEYAVNVSSGTPQIQASLQLAISAGLLSARAYQAIDPRYLRPGKEQVREVPVRYWAEAFARDRARHLFERHEFEACCHEVQFLAGAPQSDRRAAARHLHTLCRMYAAVHHIDYYGADETARNLLDAVGGADDYAAAWPLLERQAALLARLPKAHPKGSAPPANHRETPEFLADIYHNAARCYARHTYADCLARVWRVLEGALFLRLRERHGVEPADVRASANTALAAKVIAAMHQDDQARVEITLGSALRLFAQSLEDADFKALHRTPFPGTQRNVGRVLENLREARNSSVVGHDALPVTEDKAAQGLELARLTLAALVPSVDLDGHPFAPAPLSSVGEVFFKALHHA